MPDEIVLGMSTFVRAGEHAIIYLEENLFTVSLIERLLPGENVKCQVLGPNSLYLLFEKDISYGLLEHKTYHLKMETELIFERIAPDNISPLNWIFYVTKNSHFHSFGGRIRVKFINRGIKVGIFIDEFDPKKDGQFPFSYNDIKYYTRIILREGLYRLNSYLKEKCKTVPEVPHRHSLARFFLNR